MENVRCSLCSTQASILGRSLFLYDSSLWDTYWCSSFVPIFCSVVAWEHSLPDISIVLAFWLKLISPGEKPVKRQKTSCQTYFFSSIKIKHLSHPYPGETVCIPVQFVPELKVNEASARTTCTRRAGRQHLLALPCAVQDTGGRIHKLLFTLSSSSL